MEARCTCHLALQKEDVEICNTSNEVGEDYYTIFCECPVCLKPIANYSNWGSFDYSEEDWYYLFHEMRER